MGHGFLATVGCAALRAVPSTALFCLILASCNGQDQTWATGVPEVEREEPPRAPDEPPPEVVEPEREPDAPDPDAPDPGETGVTPVDDEQEEPLPVTPPAVVDAGTTPDPDPPVVAFDCSTVPAAPVTFE
jgi:hypothetical protein